MNLFFLVLIFCFFVFLYIVYFLSHDDFVILRSNTSMEKIFNSAFLAGFSSLFFARLVYVFLNPKNVFFNPLGFLLFPYFPGLSLLGGLLGGYLISLFILKSWSLPVGRIIDFFSMGFLVSFPVGLLGLIFLSREKLSLAVISSIVLFLILLFIFLKLMSFATGGKFKDGSLGLLFMSLFSFVYLLSAALVNFKKIVSFENIVFLVVFFVFLALFVKKEEIIEKLLYKKQ